MRKGLVAGLTGLACVAAMSCGEEEENPAIEIPESVKSATAAVAMRITGPWSPNDEIVTDTLSKMLNDNLSFMDVVTRGGMPDGALTANPGGTAPEQIKAFIDNGGALPADVAVDSCGNPMLTAFVTPDMLAPILPAGTNVPGLPMWPGSCAADTACNTTKQGKWEVGFSKDHGDGSRDLVLVLSPQAGPLTQPGFQGHIISYMLTANNTGNHLLSAALYGNARSVTVAAFGLVKFAKAGVSTRPSALPGSPTRVWAYPADARELAGSDLIVGISPYEFCERGWAATMQGDAPFGCDALKALVLDANTVQGRQLINDGTDNGDDVEAVTALQGDLDDLISAWSYQLKAQIACPAVTEPNWIRTDVPLGSVEIFQCPDGQIDPCIAFHDMEDYWCEATSDETPVEVAAVLPRWESPAAHADYGTTVFEADVPAVPAERQTIIYSINGVQKTFTWTLAWDPEAHSDQPLTIDQALTELNARMTAAGLNDIELTVSDDDKYVVVPKVDLGPVGTFAWGAGTLNATLGLTGSASTVSPTLTAQKAGGYLVTASNDNEDTPALVDIAYVKVSGTADEPLVIYTDEPARILGLTDGAGNPITLPTPRTDSHCESEGASTFEITGADQYLKIDVTTDGEDDIRLVPTTESTYL